MSSSKTKAKAFDIGPEAFKHIPKFLTEGAWSPVSYAFLLFAIGLIIYTTNEAMATKPIFNPSPEIDEGDGWWRFIISFYGIIIIIYIVNQAGFWPMYSFTMMSWTIFTLRYFFSALYHLDFGISLFFVISEALRFPSLVCNSITVSIWWIILVPAIYTILYYKMGKKHSIAFMKWNASPFLINVHLLNLPLCAMDHWMYPRLLTMFDLWMGIIFAICYVSFYLFVMDPWGLHFYHVILSPRPHYCFIPYSLTLSLFPLFQYLWNYNI